jgi:hypothetical protein
MAAIKSAAVKELKKKNWRMVCYANIPTFVLLTLSVKFTL